MREKYVCVCVREKYVCVCEREKYVCMYLCVRKTKFLTTLLERT